MMIVIYRKRDVEVLRGKIFNWGKSVRTQILIKWGADDLAGCFVDSSGEWEYKTGRGETDLVGY